MALGKNFVSMMVAFAAMLLTAGTGAAAQGQADPWQLGFQDALSPVAHNMHDFHNLLLWIIGIITAFVTLLLIIVIVKFNRKANPVPSKTSHNTLIEIVWTVVPIMILIAIALPSFKLLYHGDRIENPDMTLKAIGYQWYWGYEYPDQGELAFDAVMLERMS